MTRFMILGLVCRLVLCPDVGMAMSPAEACRAAAATAERQWALPSDLVGAIGRVESGRFDPRTRLTAAWPWTVNANGNGAYFPTREEAVAFVRALQAAGVRTIDVGCFQVDLLYHPRAFASLEDAFDPDVNADYAGRLLSFLHSQSRDWLTAIARYHSDHTNEGASYTARVLGEWQAGTGVVNAGNTAILRYGTPPPTVQDKFVIRMSAAARAVRIIRPAVRQ